MSNFFRRLAVHLESGKSAFVSIVVDHSRHSPGTRGAKMFVTPGGVQVGTIGGGAMEASLVEEARRFFAGDEPHPELHVLHHRRNASGERSGLICAGKQSMVYFAAHPHHHDLFDALADAVDDDEPQRFELGPDGPAIAPLEAPGGEPPVGFEQSPNGWKFWEETQKWRRIAIVGSGHCGLALSRVMAQLSYRVVVFEKRPNVFTFIENEWAHEKVVVEDYAEVGALVRRPELTHFVVMTADYPSDVQALFGGVELSFPFKGVMGSEAKIARIRTDLLELGVNPSSLDDLRAPVGLEMTSNTPQEIAISVAAQILREREKLFPFTAPSPA